MLQRIEGAFLKAVEQTLGDRYTENVSAIYKIVIKLIIQTLIDGYEKAPPGSNIQAPESADEFATKKPSASADGAKNGTSAS